MRIYKTIDASNKNIDEIYVIGHSVASRFAYFEYMRTTHRQSNWIVYFFNKERKKIEYIKLDGFWYSEK